MKKEYLNEIWKPIKGYEGLYEVSNFGRIKSLKFGKERILKGSKDKYGYYHISLSDINKKYKSFLVHRLVAEHFLDKPDNCNEVNHKDENPQNNIYTNLEWCDRKYNCNYGTRNERISKNNRGKKSYIITTEIKEKMSVSQKKRFETSSVWNKGLKNCFCEKTIEKMRNTKKNKSVVQLDLNDNYINTYISLMEAQRETNINATAIMRCCKNINKTAGGFKWKYILT